MKVITIGRTDDNDVVVNDPHASRHHLQIIQLDDGSYRLSDFGSTNGTYVNGQKVSGEIDLKPTDIIRIGNTAVPWVTHFTSDDNDTYSSPSGNADETRVEGDDTTDTKEKNDSGKAGPIIGIIISLVMIVGGLNGSLVMRGTDSSAALVVVGLVLLVIDIVKLSNRQ